MMKGCCGCSEGRHIKIVMLWAYVLTISSQRSFKLAQIPCCQDCTHTGRFNLQTSLVVQCHDKLRQATALLKLTGYTWPCRLSIMIMMTIMVIIRAGSQTPFTTINASFSRLTTQVRRMYEQYHQHKPLKPNFT